MKKEVLATGNVYHIFNRSIAKYEIFNDVDDCNRFLEILDLYRFQDFNYKYSIFSRLTLSKQETVREILKDSPMSLKIVAYSIMPTHFHLILMQLSDEGIRQYITKVLNSYSRYFNLRHRRKGPLWEGHFKSVLINSDEQLLHLSRYLHLNPVSAGMVKLPGDWDFSSYKEYLNEDSDGLSDKTGLIEISPRDYERFVKDQIAYQKELSLIKNLIIENYSG